MGDRFSAASSSLLIPGSIPVPGADAPGYISFAPLGLHRTFDISIQFLPTISYDVVGAKGQFLVIGINDEERGHPDIALFSFSPWRRMMIQLSTTVLPPEITAKLHRLKSRLRNMTIVRGLGSTVLVASTMVGLALLCDYFLDLNHTLRTGLLLFSVLFVAFTFWKRIVRPSMQSVTTEELAAIVEKQHPALKERLTSTIELNDPNIPDEHKGSAVMREWLGQETYQATAALEFEDAIPSARPKKTAMLAMCMVFLLMLPFLFSPEGYRSMWSRFLTPWGNFDSSGNLYFEIEDGNRTVARGSDVALSAKPQFRFHKEELPANVWLERQMDDGTDDRRQMAYDEKLESFVVTVPHVMHAFDYRIVTDEIRTRSYRIDVMEPPAVLTAVMEVQPPPYTGRPAVRLDGILGELSIFEHSDVRMNVTFNKPVKDFQLEWLNRDAQQSARAWEKKKEKLPKFKVAIAKDRKSATLAAKVSSSGWFVLRLRDEHGLQNLEPVERYLKVVRDMPPRLAVLGTDIAQKVRLDDTPIIRADSTDDVAVEALELHWEVLGGDKGTIAVPKNEMGVSEKSYDFRLDLKEMNLKEGSLISFRVRAADGRPVPGPQEVWSTKRTLQIHKDAKAFGSQDVAKAQREKSQKLRAIRKALEASKFKVEKLEKQAEKNLQEKTEFTKNREIDEKALRQEKLAQQLNRLADEFGVSPIYANMTQKTREIAQQQLTPAANRLKQAAGQPLAEKKRFLEENVDQLEKIIDELKKLESDHDELAGLERDLLELMRLAKKASDLANEATDQEKKQASVDRQPPGENKNTQQQKLTEEQQKLLAEAMKLGKELFDLLKDQPELLDAAKQAQFEKLLDLVKNTKDLAEQQQELVDALKNHAGETAKNSAPQIEQQKGLVEQAQKQQLEIAKDAAKLALEMAREQGADSKVAKDAHLFAQKANDASRRAMAGLMKPASKSAEQASQSAKKVADEGHKQNSSLAPQLKKQAQQLAQRQQETAEQLKKIAESPQQQQQSLQRGQNRLADSAKNISEQVDKIADNLSRKPLDEKKKSEEAKSIADLVKQARREMTDAQKELQQSNPGKAAQYAEKAAQKLSQACKCATGSGKSKSPVPSSVGEKVSDAARNLSEASKKMSAQKSPSSQSGTGKSGKGQGKKSNGKSSSAGGKSGKGQGKGQGQPSYSKELQKAAEDLAKAVQQLFPDMPNPSGGKGSQAGKSGTGNESEMDIEKLTQELKRLKKRDWGKLPGKLRTEILQAARKKPNSDYAYLIKLYFKEIADTRKLDDEK